MTVAEWCVFGAVLVYLLSLAPAKAVGFRRFDNANPRDPTFYEHPLRKRVLGAHITGIETFPFFAVAMLLAEATNTPRSTAPMREHIIPEVAERLIALFRHAEHISLRDS